jgi:hypothetical protein
MREQMQVSVEGGNMVPLLTLRDAGRVLGLGDNPPPTLSVPEAGRIIGLGRNAAYAASAKKVLPVLDFGRLKRVPVVRLAAMMLAVREPEAQFAKPHNQMSRRENLNKSAVTARTVDGPKQRYVRPHNLSLLIAKLQAIAKEPG